MKITDALLGEHAILYAMFEELERVGDSQVPIEAKQELVRSVGRALLSHARVEDELLFPALGDLPPVRVMRADHTEIDRLFAELGAASPPADFAAALSSALELTRQHFHKEEAVLFPHAARHLDVSQLEHLGEQWGRLRGVTLG